jgi:glycosyltransferase involved in cell wall biosynthesis
LTSPFFSVIIPSYNYGKYITNTIDSLQNQTFTEWECLIIDDESSDNTGDIVREIAARDPRIKYFFQKNTGQSGARNLGLANSSGKYIQFLDADDYLENHKFENFHRFIQKNKNADVYYSQGRLFYDDDINKRRINYPGLEEEEWTLQVSGQGDVIIREFLDFNRFLINMPVVNGDLARKFKMDQANQGNEDWDFWMRLAVNGARFQYITPEGDDFSLLRLHDVSFSTRDIPMTKSRIHMRRSWQKLLTDKDLFKRNNLKLQASEIALGVLLKKDGQTWEGIKSLYSAVYPFYSLKRSLFAILGLFLSGRKTYQLLLKVTGQV